MGGWIDEKDLYCRITANIKKTIVNMNRRLCSKMSSGNCNFKVIYKRNLAPGHSPIPIVEFLKYCIKTVNRKIKGPSLV
jgi:hypothetical protein